MNPRLLGCIIEKMEWYKVLNWNDKVSYKQKKQTLSREALGKWFHVWSVVIGSTEQNSEERAKMSKEFSEQPQQQNSQKWIKYGRKYVLQTISCALCKPSSWGCFDYWMGKMSTDGLVLYILSHLEKACKHALWGVEERAQCQLQASFKLSFHNIYHFDSWGREQF